LQDLFFEFPLNNFLHNVVYDMVQQVLGGKATPGPNRDLIVSLFCEARLVEQLLDAQRLNDTVV
jgi:SIT4-associating protein SAP185/190